MRWRLFSLELTALWDGMLFPSFPVWDDDGDGGGGDNGNS